MKQKVLIKLFQANGWYLKRHGGNHDIWTTGKEVERIPRHPMVRDSLAKGLIRKHGLK